MDLEKLQSKGAIHIGRKTGRMVLYAYALDEAPDRIVLGWTREPVSIPRPRHETGQAGDGRGPVIEAVLERTAGKARFLMICHHSSAKELMDKIHSGLVAKGKAAVAPKGVVESTQEVWLSARFEDVVFVYPPFAKIFLSEVPTFADERRSAVGEDDPENSGEEMGKVRAGAYLFGTPHGDEDDERRSGLVDTLMLRTAGARSFVSVVLLLAIIFGSAFLLLERLKASDEGRAWLMSVETMIGFSFGADEEHGYGFLSRAEKDLRRRQAKPSEDFMDWYDPARTDDAGSTFGMPREHRGFYIKTWTDGPEGDRNLYAAYRFNPETAWQGETDEQRRVSKKLMHDLLRIPEMADDLHVEACRALRGEASSLAAEEFRKVEVVVVHDQDIFAAFKADEASCARGTPSLRKIRGQ